MLFTLFSDNYLMEFNRFCDPDYDPIFSWTDVDEYSTIIEIYVGF